MVLGGIEDSQFVKDAFDTNFSTFKPPSSEDSETTEGDSDMEEMDVRQRKIFQTQRISLKEVPSPFSKLGTGLEYY